MPVLPDLPEYINIDYKYTHKTMLLFESDSIALIVKYDDKTYKSEKDKLSEKYTFLDKKVPSNYEENKYCIPENEFLINSYVFKIVGGTDKNNKQFPKYFGMIGTSDDKKSIAYMYFYDSDLDYIGEKGELAPMANFVKEYFEYDF